MIFAVGANRLAQIILSNLSELHPQSLFGVPYIFSVLSTCGSRRTNFEEEFVDSPAHSSPSFSQQICSKSLPAVVAG